MSNGKNDDGCLKIVFGMIFLGIFLWGLVHCNSSQSSYNDSASTSGGSEYVSGHTRTSKNGKTYYVRPHSRKRR